MVSFIAKPNIFNAILKVPHIPCIIYLSRVAFKYYKLSQRAGPAASNLIAPTVSFFTNINAFGRQTSTSTNQAPIRLL